MGDQFPRAHGYDTSRKQQQSGSDILSHMSECIFCKIIKGEVPAYILDENEAVIALLSLENHPMIVPKKHIPDIYTLDEETAAAVMVEAVKIARAVKKGVDCDGINLVQANEPAAQQDVFHFHLHIKPRWQQDSVFLRWDTQPAAATELRASLEKIRAAL